MVPSGHRLGFVLFSDLHWVNATPPGVVAEDLGFEKPSGRLEVPQVLAPRLLGSIAGILFLAGCAATPPPATQSQNGPQRVRPPVVASPTPRHPPPPAHRPHRCRASSRRSPSAAPSRASWRNFDPAQRPIRCHQHRRSRPRRTGGTRRLFAYEDLTIGSDVWSRSNGEPWGEPTGRSADVARLRRSIDQASRWTDLGAQAPASPSVRRLKAAGAPVDAEIRPGVPSGIDSSLTLEIETADDGSPVAMHIAGKALSADLACGGGRTVSRPASPPDWKRVELSHGVSVAVPDGRELDRSDPTKLVVLVPTTNGWPSRALRERIDAQRMDQ